ncbi:hypothetical protein HDU76_011809 [Blyttiomyces sp. JEL0837]|nr:hypothetical protein HDU76_011809 [Blyttiomyces sp. JEL0837]
MLARSTSPNPSITVQPTPSHILVAVDESTHSIAALSWCFEYLVKTPQDKISVVCVISSEAERLATTSRLQSLLRALLSQYPLLPQTISLTIHTPIGFGNQTGPLICSQVEKLKPSMMVIGSAGKSHMEGMMMGSVSNYCIMNAACPVVVARLTNGEEKRRVKGLLK